MSTFVLRVGNKIKYNSLVSPALQKYNRGVH